MPIHDSFARITPFELLLPGPEFAGERFPLIRQEAEERGGSLHTPESFLLLAEAAVTLREIRGEGDGPELLQQHGALLFQAFHFWQEGTPLMLLGSEVVRYLVQTGPEEGEWTPNLPGRAGYIQLPQHMVWTTGSEGEAPESLDGVFWASPDDENVTLLIALGMRKDRPGLAVVPLPTLPLAAAAPWASTLVRPEGRDFSPTLPGAELEGLYSVEAGAEVVKLAMRIFWYLDVFPGRVKDGSTPGTASGPARPSLEGDSGPQPSGLPYRRVILGEG